MLKVGDDELSGGKNAASEESDEEDDDELTMEDIDMSELGDLDEGVMELTEEETAIEIYNDLKGNTPESSWMDYIFIKTKRLQGSVVIEPISAMGGCTTAAR